MNDQLRILVVEDDLVDSKAVCRMLTRVEERRQIDTASSLEQAKQKSREGRYDAVILDLGLPDSQGVDSVIEFQASVPEVPIVVVSGMNDEKLALRSLGLGAEDFISKDSITEHGLDRSLRYSIERHRRKTDVYKDLDGLKVLLDNALAQAASGKNSVPNQVKHSWSKEAPGPSQQPLFAANLSDLPPLVQFIRTVRPLQASDTLATYLSYGFSADGWRMTAPAVAQARLANCLSEMTLECLRRAQAWHVQNPQIGGLHLDVEADAIQPWARRQMAQIFPDGLTRSNCVLFVNTNFPKQPRNMFLSEILRLKKAGFKIGIGNVGSGATVLEELQRLKPDWLRFDPSLTLQVGRYSSKARTLKKIVDSLRPLKAHMIADEIEEDVDLQQLLEFGFDAYYAAPGLERPAADLSENVS